MIGVSPACAFSVSKGTNYPGFPSLPISSTTIKIKPQQEDRFPQLGADGVTET